MGPSRKPASHAAGGPGAEPIVHHPQFANQPESVDAIGNPISNRDQCLLRGIGTASIAMPANLQDLDALSTSYATQRHDALDGGYGSYPFTPFGTDKFPAFDAWDSSLMYGPGMLAPPSMSSPSSTISRRSSWRSTLSSVPTEVPSQQGSFLPGDPVWSRGPSPLHNIMHTLSSPSEASCSTMGVGEAEYVCLAPGCEAKFLQNKDLEAHDQIAHSHACLWRDNGPCKSGGFATRDALNWHVKSEHLLVCPVLGCTATSFATKNVLDCHVRWAHKNIDLEKGEVACQSSNLLGGLTMQRSLSSSSSAEVQASGIKREPSDDRRLKTEMSIAISKKRCREQLKKIIDKKCKTGNAATPRSIESPGMLGGRTPKMRESLSFPIVWEHGVLPFLVEFIPKWCGQGHVISIIRGEKRDSRRICFMTKKPVSKARKIMIAGHVRDLLPEGQKCAVSFVFSVGEVNRLTWARGLSKAMPDEVCIPRNPFCYISPSMGDSIGAVLPNGDDTTATLGPCIMIGNGSFWLANLHPFIEASQTGEVATIEHPSPEDRDRCLQGSHDALEGRESGFHLGELTATCGYDLRTTRISHDPYWEDCEKEPPLVVTDWSLISAQTRQANILRKFPSTATPKREVPITKTSSIIPGIEVCSTGRTSGYQHGQVCEIPAYVDGDHTSNGTGKATREWYIEEPYTSDNEDAWIRGGIGVPGDSGAAVVDCETDALIGQLWGRNRYFGPGPRMTFFTPISDILDDIQERCGEQTRPYLPQYHDEADLWSVYPICRPCFDLQEYMATRRSSRESLMSMIPGSGAPGENDHDLVSVSELATPKSGGDQAYYLRHAGAEDAGSSFNSVVSPAPVMSTFFYNPHVASPRVGLLEMRSPYALELHNDDLNDGPSHDGADASGVVGKRAAIPAAMVRSGSQLSGKKRRIV